jgi:hypothetical protein
MLYSMTAYRPDRSAVEAASQAAAAPVFDRRLGSAAVLRCAWTLAAAAFCAVAAAQSALPPTPLTQAVTPVVPAAASAAAPVGTQPAHRPAHVSCTNGLLEVEANGSSLNQIVRDAAAQCSFTVHGGVSEESVYGTYGPATPGEVLSTLLEGTGLNMILLAGSSSAPGELRLSPRAGGPTTFAQVNQPAQTYIPSPPVSYQPPPAQAFAPGLQNGMQPGLNGQAPMEGTEAGAAAGTTTTEQSPNGVKTPQEIFDQLMKMQQAAKQTAPH